MVEKNLKKLQAKKRRVTNGFNTGTRDMKLKTAYRRRKRWSADSQRCRPSSILTRVMKALVFRDGIVLVTHSIFIQ